MSRRRQHRRAGSAMRASHSSPRGGRIRPRPRRSECSPTAIAAHPECSLRSRRARYRPYPLSRDRPSPRWRCHPLASFTMETTMATREPPRFAGGWNGQVSARRFVRRELRVAPDSVICLSADHEVRKAAVPWAARARCSGEGRRSAFRSSRVRIAPAGDRLLGVIGSTGAEGRAPGDRGPRSRCGRAKFPTTLSWTSRPRASVRRCSPLHVDSTRSLPHSRLRRRRGAPLWKRLKNSSS